MPHPARSTRASTSSSIGPFTTCSSQGSIAKNFIVRSVNVPSECETHIDFNPTFVEKKINFADFSDFIAMDDEVYISE